MFARRVIDYGFAGQLTKSNSIGGMTGVLNEVSLNEPNRVHGLRSKVSAKGQSRRSLQQLFKKSSFESAKRVTKTNFPGKDVLPKSLSIPEDDEMEEECIDEPFDALYTADIHAYVKSIETKCCPGQRYLDADITPSNRKVLVAWMREVQEYLEMHQETFHLAVIITDLIVDRVNVKLQEYQLVGLVGFFVAAKYLERYIPQIDTLIYLASYAYDSQTIIAKEKEILRIIDYDLNLPTPAWFLEYYSKDQEDNSVRETAALFLDLFSLDAESVILIPPSMRAASSLMIANELFARPKGLYQPDIETKSGYSSARLEPANDKLKALITGLYAAKKKCSLEENILSVLSAIRTSV